ncbi:kielin/chordin-like protein [Dreissena polymorpha]|uniref:kielin/chordin-like protein n=1 Tax=Dreissena polymorpha TaxID=45954 RepID=UPI00226476C8|nr:kielin/chordin-like protein [Dreissena polymorpha]
MTYSDGKTFSSVDGCNNCTCTAGKVTCTNETCGVSCNYANKTYSDGKTFTNSDGCNNCTCAAGKVLCTNETCSLSNCDYNGHQYASGATFKSDDNCNSCFCTNGVVGCTKMACIDTCETQKLRECFLDLVDTTFYAMTEPNKLWMCRSKDAVQSCVERNLKVCQKEFGAVMTAVLTPHVRVMTTLTDAFCSMD